ncbi:MAG: Rieske 2Fe-2S domain-containing protein [Candidatus Eremiobacterota bacterium]
MKAAVPLSQVRERAARGEILVIREVLSPDEMDWLRQLLGPEAPDGVEQIHRHLDPARLVQVTEAMTDAFRRMAPDFLGEVLPRLGFSPPFFFERTPNVRVHLPYGSWLQGRRDFQEHARLHGDGKLSVHSPHRDSDHGCPVNAINLWLALGRVRPGNGLCIYPRGWNRELDADVFAEAVSFDLEPGDAVVFAGEHLHTSELNCTDESRFVASFRLTPELPRFRAPSLHEYVCSHPSLSSRLRQTAQRAVALLSPKREAAETAFPPRPAPKVELRDGAYLVEAEGPAGIWPLSEKLCLVRFEDGQGGLIHRRCPHQGTDLAAVGQVHGHRVVCPWHNVTLDPPCPALKPVRIPCQVERQDGRLLLRPEEPS